MAYDIWALGCTVVQLLTGKEPWHEIDNDPISVLKNLKTTDSHPTIPDEISKECKSFLQGCFKHDINERATTKDLLKHPFVKMTEVEIKESLEASNFISFFSILASQKSLSDHSN